LVNTLTKDIYLSTKGRSNLDNDNFTPPVSAIFTCVYLHFTNNHTKEITIIYILAL